MTERVDATPPIPLQWDWRRLLSAWPLILGFVALAAPTVQSLARQIWTTEAGAHGPIVLFTGAWLLGREADSFRKLGAPGSLVVGFVGLVAALLLYVFGRAFDFISLEAIGVYGVGLVTLHARFGFKPILRNWFPLLYLAFLVPAPGWLMDEVTAPLKQFVSHMATGVLSTFGIPISREGVTIFVGQYQLLVEDACSGMNSLVGLAAISLFYIYLMRGSSVAYSLLLALFIPPIAIVGNIARIMILILLTYFFGDAVAQGFLHVSAGMLLFALDLLLVFALDTLLWQTFPRLRTLK